MSRKSVELSDALYDYLLSVSLREPDILCRLREATATNPLAEMQIAPEQGQFMALLIQLIGARRIIEIGVFTGYSSLAMALALPDSGQIIACDNDDQETRLARQFWLEAGVMDKIDFRLAPALATLDELLREGRQDEFDFVFIDADKENYIGYFERALSLVRQGGLIAVDNVLWSGKPADPSVMDTSTVAIREFNQKLAQDDRITLSMLPIADGLTLAMKR